MKYQVNATGCPDPIGAASKGTTAGRLVFVSGQVSLSADGTAVIGADVGSQTSRILDQAEAVLAEVGLELDDIAKVTVISFRKTLLLGSRPIVIIAALSSNVSPI